VVLAGYDMEDAMILNAAAVQRGLAHGSLYKTDAVDLADEKGKQLVRVLTTLLGLCEESHCCSSMRSESGETQRGDVLQHEWGLLTSTLLKSKSSCY